MNHRSNLIVGGVVAALLLVLVTAVAQAASGEMNVQIQGIPPSQFQINPKTCRFLHREIDPPTPKAVASLSSVVGAVNALRVYALYEDKRHDVKMACLAKHMRSAKRGPRGPMGPAGPSGKGGLVGYIQVTASGTGASVTATCPAGDVVLGGGSPDETTGSYPSSKTAWTIRRDHLSPPRMTVIATCAKAAS